MNKRPRLNGSFPCIECEGKTIVLDTRWNKEKLHTRRIRICLICDINFTTVELVKERLRHE